MHGLINRGIQRFVTDSYGESTWLAVVARAELGFSDFEAMMMYDDALTPRVLQAVCDVLERSFAETLEDLGTYLVSNRNLEALRRLLRFGGVTFVEFINSLDDLPDRARLAVSDLVLPAIEILEESPERYSLKIYGAFDGWGHLFVGVLRAMADDYGVLAFLEHRGREGSCEVIEVTLLETEFAVGRGFQLGVRSA
ncbi:MAG: heme NO-binding domain-containing protein [Pseudomonadota bacterium]